MEWVDSLLSYLGLGLGKSKVTSSDVPSLSRELKDEASRRAKEIRAEIVSDDLISSVIRYIRQQVHKGLTIIRIDTKAMEGLIKHQEHKTLFIQYYRGAILQELATRLRGAGLNADFYRVNYCDDYVEICL